MGNVQPLRQHPPRSPEREQLAAAIEHRRQVADQLARVTSVAEVHIIGDAQEKVEQAEQVLAKARKLESRRTVAELTGADISDFGPTVQSAEFLLEDARADLERAKQTREAVDAEQGKAESALANATSLLRDSVRTVIQSEGGADKVLAQHVEARREVARLHEILALLGACGCLPAYWDALAPFPPTQADKPWREALGALEADADAPLPK
jgi:hypothetical protein